MMNGTQPFEPLPQSENIYGFRHWCARFLPHVYVPNDGAAFNVWFQFVRSWSQGNN